MKNNLIFSLPTHLSNFSEPEKSGRTTASLKVFFKGETPDGRIFTEEFSKKLADTLPNTPVVAFYDEEKKDFVGHNSTQYIYGIISSDAKYSFEKEGDVEWLVTEVILYTDRLDNIGEVAKKIVGSAQSLEMDPLTAKYEFVKEDGKRKIKFLEGKLVGLSVLGTNETPAFTGSEFFKLHFKNLEERFENFLNHLNNQQERGNMNMNQEAFQKYLDFLSLSYNQKMKLAYEALGQRFKDEAISYGILDMNDDAIIYETYDWNTDKIETKRVSYTIENEIAILSENVEDVIKVYVTKEEFEKINMSNLGEANGETNLQQQQEGEGQTNVANTTAALSEEEKAELEKYREQAIEQTKQLEDFKIQLEISGKEKQDLVVELESYKKKEKESLLESFKGLLGEEAIKKYDVDKYATFAELEIALALEFTNKKREAPATPLIFGSPKPVEDSKENLLFLVKKYKNK